MIVLDTHVWLWWVSAPERLTPRVHAVLARGDRVGVCTISAWEIAMLVLRSRISLDRDVDVWVRQALAQPDVEPLPLTADVAVAAAVLEREGLGGDPADRIIYATARANGARLATRDAALRDFDPARALW